MRRANAHIMVVRRAAAAQAPSSSAVPPLDPSRDLLTLDEVLAVRLYSGPAYQPINTFLRQFAKLEDDSLRMELARQRARHNEELTAKDAQIQRFRFELDGLLNALKFEIANNAAQSALRHDHKAQANRAHAAETCAE